MPGFIRALASLARSDENAPSNRLSRSASMTPHTPAETRDLRIDSPPVAPQHADTVERVGRFLVRRLVGEGAFGRVYEAFDPQLERPVALKVARPEALTTPDRAQRFLDEARAVANL